MMGGSFTSPLRKYRWLIAFLAVFAFFAAVVVAGYSVGKEMALRDNATDRLTAPEARR